MDTPVGALPPRIVPPPQPLGAVGFARAFLRNPLEAIPQAAYREDAGRVTTWPSHGVWITAPALLKRVFLDERDLFSKQVQIRLFEPLLGHGILTSEGAHWKWQRQASAPMFRPAALQACVPTFVRAAESWLAKPGTEPDSRGTETGLRPGSPEVVDIDAAMSRVTFDVISSTLLPATDEPTRREFQRCVQVLQRFGGWDILYAYLRAPQWMPRPSGAAKLRATRWLRATVAELVRLRRREGRRDLVQSLMDARDPETGRGMDDAQLVDNLLTFYLAGHETTAKALTWTLYLLARYPLWQERARQDPAVAEMVLKESMRLYPPVPVMSRQPRTAVEIGGLRVPAGGSVLVPIYAMHRHAARWERPDHFEPARFAPGNEERIPRYQYMPFGAGPRICIGMSFAMLEATTILTTLLRHARFECADAAEPRLLAGVTLMPRGGLRLRVLT